MHSIMLSNMYPHDLFLYRAINFAMDALGNSKRFRVVIMLTSAVKLASIRIILLATVSYQHR